MPPSCQDGDPAGWHHTIARFTLVSVAGELVDLAASDSGVRANPARAGCPGSVPPFRRLCSAVISVKAALAQDGSHPLQLSVHPLEFSGQGRAVAGRRRPLLLPAGTRGEQFFLFVA